MEVKDIIRNRRIEKHMTMKELAERVGVSEATISRWESGDIENMRRDKVSKLSKVLDITPEVIMGWSDDERFAGYYLNDETARIAQEIFDDPRKRALFDASRKATPEALDLVAKMLEELNK